MVGQEFQNVVTYMYKLTLSFLSAFNFCIPLSLYILASYFLASLPPLTQHMTVLISLMSDPTVQVQDTAAWTLGRVCDQIPEAALSDQCRDGLLNGLALGLDKEPRVAASICWVSGLYCCLICVYTCF